MTCTRLRPGHLSERVGDSSRRSEEIVKNLELHLSIRLLTYLCPSLPVEHRPSTTPRHRTLFWAALVILDQLVPCCCSSASVSRLQLLRGRPLFLFPCGFQVRAWRVVLDAGFLRVCPIQPHFLRSICLATGSCPARSHRSSFRIFSCHWILQMRLRQVLISIRLLLLFSPEGQLGNCLLSPLHLPPRWPSGKSVRLESGRPGFDSLLRRDQFSGLVLQ